MTRRSAPDLLRVRAELDPKDAPAILRWTVETFPRVGLTLSFGGTGIILAHLASRLNLRLPVYFLDTGFLFPETLATRQAFVERYGIEVMDVRPERSVEDQAELYGPELYRRDPDLCCHLRKVLPLQRVLAQLDAWVTGLRRDQGPTRATVEILEEHRLPDGRSIVKVNPLAHWTRQEAWTYILEHGLPYNPLLDRGYRSLGCQPCTRPVAPDAPERSGRWAGTGKQECGLHTFTTRLEAPQAEGGA